MTHPDQPLIRKVVRPIKPSLTAQGRFDRTKVPPIPGEDPIMESGLARHQLHLFFEELVKRSEH